MPKELPKDAYCPRCGKEDFLGWLIGGVCKDCIKEVK